MKRNREKVEKILEEKVKELSALYQISKDIDKIKVLDELYSDIALVSYKAMNYPGAFFIIWLFNGKNNRVIKAFKGIGTLRQAEEYLRRSENFSVSVNVGRKRIGGFVVGYKSEKVKVAKEEKDFIREIAVLLGKEIERRKAKEDLSRMFIEIVMALSAALDARDHYTVNHSRRIATHCRLIAERLNLNDREKENLVMAALLHDIGKIGISDRILGKPARLTQEEFDKVKKHPLIAEEILRPIEALKGSLKAMKYHHERHDGNGYPDGLKGEKIPVGARILAVCDAYDAMVSERPYRKAMSIKDAIGELKKNSGTQFDPNVTQIMVDLVEREYFS